MGAIMIPAAERSGACMILSFRVGFNRFLSVLSPRPKILHWWESYTWIYFRLKRVPDGAHKLDRYYQRNGQTAFKISEYWALISGCRCAHVPCSRSELPWPSPWTPSLPYTALYDDHNYLTSDLISNMAVQNEEWINSKQKLWLDLEMIIYIYIYI